MKMKVLVLSLLVAGGMAFSCQSDKVSESEKIEKAEQLDPTSIEFTETEYDFGTVVEGDQVEHSFEFKNTGDKELIIVDAKGSCGCTVPTFPEEPIMPGETGKIDVVFNSDKRVGEVKKSVTVIANTNPSKTVVYLVGKVEE